MDTRDAARRWVKTWLEAWPSKDIDAITALQAEDGDHWASLFRPYRGRAGLRDYLVECFDEETAPAEARYAEPFVDGDTASVEYWAVIQVEAGPVTISGCSVLRFNEAGLIVESRDYSRVKEGRHIPPVDIFG